MATIKEEIEKFKKEYNHTSDEHKHVMAMIAILKHHKWEKIYDFIREQEKK